MVFYLKDLNTTLIQNKTGKFHLADPRGQCFDSSRLVNGLTLRSPKTIEGVFVTDDHFFTETCTIPAWEICVTCRSYMARALDNAEFWGHEKK